MEVQNFMVDRILTADTLGEILAHSRTKSNKSQKYMAKALGKSVGTIINWESGIGSPNLIDLLLWFDILSVNPLRYMLETMRPDLYANIKIDGDADRTRSALLMYIRDAATDDEIRKISYCIFGNTGSNWKAQLEMLTAHNHTTMKSRVNVAQTIYDNFVMEYYRKELVDSEHVTPDPSYLKEAIEKAKVSAKDAIDSYSHL